jgi:hypothetical protein
VPDQRRQRLGDQDVAAARADREAGAEALRGQPAPRPGGVDDRADGHLAAAGADAGEPPAVPGHRGEHLGAPGERGAEAPGLGQLPGRRQHRLHLAVLRVAHAAGHGRGDPRFGRGQARRVKRLCPHPGRPLPPGELAQRGELRLIARDDHAALGIELELIAIGGGKLGPQRQAAQRQPELGARQLVRDEDVAFPAGSGPGDRAAPVHHAHRPPGGGQRPRAARADKPGTDHHDVGGGGQVIAARRPSPRRRQVAGHCLEIILR